MLPKTLKEANCYAFADCKNLRLINVEDGCGASLRDTRVPDSTKVCLPPETMVGEVKLLDLRNCKQIVIPDGIERIGNHWFWGSLVEHVTIPASVREICVNAFCICEKLKDVIFAEGSRLKVIEREAFYSCSSLQNIQLPDYVEEIGLDAFNGTGLESFVAPPSLRVLRQSAFQDCKNLKYVKLNEGLEVLGTDEHPGGWNWCGVFQGIAVECVELPSTLRRIESSTFWGCKNLKSIELPERL